MTQAEYIIIRFGGLAALGRAVGRAPSVVQGWKERGTIPVRHHAWILDAGSILNPPLEMTEFFEDSDTGARHDSRPSLASDRAV